LTTGSASQIREIKAGSSYLGASDVRAHFGLGTNLQADRLEIRWPSGRSEVLQRIQGNAVITIVEGQGITKRVTLVR
jgi:hypothetical protein